MRHFFTIAAALMIASPAAADWALQSTVQTLPERTQTTWQHTWTGTPTASSGIDVSACENVEAKFDPSTGDASTDATVNLLECKTASDATGNCRPLAFPRNNETDFARLNSTGKYLKVQPSTGTSGGDTAAVTMRCTTSVADTDYSWLQSFIDFGVAYLDELLFDVRHASRFLNGGTDYGAAVMAAYADCLNDGADICPIKLPRGDSFSQSTVIDDCSTSTSTPMRLIGYGPQRSGESGTRLVATSALVPPPLTCSMTANADGGPGGKDQYEGCDFYAAGFRRGDIIREVSGFPDAVNNWIRGTERPLKVWKATTNALVVTQAESVDAGMIDDATPDTITIQKAAVQARLCERRSQLEGVMLDGASVADIGLYVMADNGVANGCTANGVPHTCCTGDGTGPSCLAIAPMFVWGDDVVSANHRVANYVFGSPAESGQMDMCGLKKWEAYNAPINVWIDALQAQPSVSLLDGGAALWGRTGIYNTAGGFTLTRGTSVTGSASTNPDCNAATFGTCRAIEVAAANRDNIEIRDHVLEVSLGHGVRFAPGSSTNFSESFEWTGGQLVLSHELGGGVDLIDFNQAGSALIRTNIHSTSSVVTAPRVTFKNSVGSVPLALRFESLLTGTVPAGVVIEDSTPNLSLPVVTHATDCKGLTNGTYKQVCVEEDRLPAGPAQFYCLPIAATGATEMCDDATEWLGPF